MSVVLSFGHTYDSKPHKSTGTRFTTKVASVLFKMWWVLLIGLFLAFYLYVKKKFEFFEKLGIPHQPGKFPFGSDCTWKMMSQKISFVQVQDLACEAFPEAKIVGYYGLFGTPYFVVQDFELMKSIMIKDFDHFVDRRPMKLHPSTNKYMNKFMSMQEGQEWRNHRSMMTPIFTSGKLKAIMPTIKRDVLIGSTKFKKVAKF